MTEQLRGLPDLASRALGGAVLVTNDDFFADVHQLLEPAPAVHDPAAYGPRGKIYDGWETRRRRTPGDDWVLVRLGIPGIVRGAVVDTAHFTGNYPPAASVAVACVLGYPTAAELQDADWTTVVDHAALTGDHANVLPVAAPDRIVTHVRLTIHPDGGVARFRVPGEVVPDPRRLGGRIDLSALGHGGRIDDCSDMFYGAPANVLAPGLASVMSDGWETRRRRDAGNDWLVVALAAPGELHEAVIDTSRFVGNAPGEVMLTDADSGAVLLPRTRVLPDTEHRFRLASGPAVSRVRLDVYPDGGMSRLRLIGSVAVTAQESLARRWLDLLPTAQAGTVGPDDLFA